MFLILFSLEMDEKRRGLTWLAIKYSSKLQAAPAQAVCISTPVFLTISDIKGNIRNMRGRYWKKTMKPSIFMVATAGERAVLGDMIHITSCMPTINDSTSFTHVAFKPHVHHKPFHLNL
jgi:hypothetical protein